MIKSMSLLTRKDGMSVEDFQKYWREVHGPIVARMPGLQRYVQSPTLVETYAGDTPPDYDGIAETWWGSVEAFEQSRATPEAQAAAADARNFVGSSIRLLAKEVPLIDAFPSPRDRQSMLRVVAMLMLQDGASVEAFQKHWREVHGPLNVKTIVGMRRYVQAHVLPGTFNNNPLGYAGLPESWFDSLEAFQGRPRDPNAPRDLEWPRYCKGQKQILTREVIVVDP